MLLLPPMEAVGAFLDRLHRPAKLLVACSGGSDSTGLLIALHQALAARPNCGVELVAATVDHRLRPEAAEEAQAVARLCETLSIPHILLRWDEDKPSSGLSAAAREARYRLLLQAARLSQATLILTGHTADDQIETAAMRAARSDSGSNLGLAGMAEAVLLDRSVWLFRPLLATRRSAIREFLAAQGIRWVDDPSNVDTHYERVRVRATLAGALDGNALATVQAAGQERYALAQEAAVLARQHLTVQHGVLAGLDRAVLGEDPGAQRHLLSTLTAVLGGRPHLPAKTAMDRVLQFLAAGRPGRICAGRVIFDLRRSTLFMHREDRNLPTVDLAPGASVVWDGRYVVTNGSALHLSVEPTLPDRDGAAALFPVAPPAVAQRAMAAMPRSVVAAQGRAGLDKADVIIRPILAPFDRFLPQFELSLAHELGILFACDDHPALPVDVYRRKS